MMLWNLPEQKCDVDRKELTTPQLDVVFVTLVKNAELY